MPINQTKGRGETDFKGISQALIAADLTRAWNGYDALDSEEKKVRNAGRFKLEVEMYASKDSVMIVSVPLKLLLAANLARSNIAAMAAALPADGEELHIPIPRAGSEDRPGVANQLKSKSTRRRIGREIKIELPNSYDVPKAFVADSRETAGSITQKYKHLTLRVPQQVPIVAVGVFLGQLNTVISDVANQFKYLYGPSGADQFFVPGAFTGGQTLADAIASLATGVEVAASPAL